MKTELGKYLINFRLEKGENLKTMSEKLGFSSAFLSAIENGNKKVPKNFVDKFSSEYELCKEEVKSLKNAIFESSKQVTLNTSNLTGQKKCTVLKFARHFEDITDEECSEIMEILDKRKGAD